LTAAGIHVSPLPNAAADLIARLQEGKDPAGLVVATGTPPVPGTGPKLRLIINPPMPTPDSQEDATIDFRSYRRPIATAGQVVADIAYESPPVPGRAVTGESILPPAGDSLPDLEAGEGIAADGGRFVATVAGVVVYDGKTLAVGKTLIHEGDVNLASGDIVFDGPVEIKGAVDSGACVRATGDIIIHGEVRGGRIDCGGNLTVALGIVTGPGGQIKVKGNVQAAFIENTTVYAGGTVMAQRSIMQATVMAGGEIVVGSADGLAGGGVFICGKTLRTASLGMPDGRITQVDVGVDYRRELAVVHRQARVDRLMRQAEEDRKTLKAIVRRPAAQRSRTEKASMETIRQHLVRLGEVIEVARGHLERAMKAQAYDSDATIQVRGKLSSNCQLRIGGKTIPVTGEVIGVKVTSKELDGSYLRVLDAGKDGKSSAA
jgi:uncharacterized protein (DUF342 family)